MWCEGRGGEGCVVRGGEGRERCGGGEGRCEVCCEVL